jgi:hypothetical protein
MTIIRTNNTNTNYTINDLTNGTPYNVRVAAVNSVGQGPFTPWGSGTPSAPPNDPYYYNNVLLMHFDDNRTGTFDQYGDYVSLLMHMDGPNNSTTFIDSSLYNRNITVNGPAKLSSSQSIFGGISAAFDADTSYLRVASGSDFAFPSDFTIECWVYFTNSSRGYQGIIGAHNGSDQTGWNLYLETNNILYFAFSAGNGWIGSVNSGETITPNEWHHIAVSRSGSSLRIFIDGTLKGTITSNVNIASGSVIDIGDYTCLNQYGYNLTMSGYIDELRITKGIARYTSSFTVPSNSFPAILPSFVDSSVYQRTITPYGNAVLSSSKNKFGDSSVYFDGSGDYLSVANGGELNLGIEDFTIECWFNSSNLSGNCGIFGWQANQSGSDPIVRLGVLSGVVNFAYRGGSYTTAAGLNSQSPINSNQWYHIAVSRHNNVIRLYLDGVLQEEHTPSNPATLNAPFNPNIGAIPFDGTATWFFNGYIDDLRITKGIARYTSNFNVPTYAFSNSGLPPTVPSEPLSLTAVENNNSVTLNWSRPLAPLLIDNRSPITYYGVEYSNDNGSSWTEDSGPFIVESTLNFNSLSDFNNNFVTTEPNYNVYSINNGLLQINCPSQDRISQYYFKENKNILDFEMRFSHTYHAYRVPSITFYGSLGSVQAYYNNNWPADQGWDSLGRNRNNVIVGITPAGGSTTWYAHSSPRLDSNGQFDTIKISIDTIAKTATLIINGISNTYNSNMFSGGFQNVYFDPMNMNFCTSYVTFIDYIKYTKNDTSVANRKLLGLSGGSPYLFRVRAQNSVGFGNYSSTTNILTSTNPPSGVNAIPDNNQAFVSWISPTSNNSSIKDYSIQYSSDAGNYWDTYSHPSSIDTLINVTGLNNGSDYIFRIAPVNFAGIGTYSGNSSSVTVAPRSDSLYNKTRLLLHLDSN